MTGRQAVQRATLGAIRRPTIRITPVTLGIVAGLMAVGLEAFLTVHPPGAYGICIACHGRDLANTIVNGIGGAHLPVAEVSVAFPLLTVAGVIIGAVGGAVAHGDFRWHVPDFPVRTFVWGFVVMNFALLAGACSIRLVLRAAHGEALGVMGSAAMAAGIVGATLLMKWRALR